MSKETKLPTAEELLKRINRLAKENESLKAEVYMLKRDLESMTMKYNLTKEAAKALQISRNTACDKLAAIQRIFLDSKEVWND